MVSVIKPFDGKPATVGNGTTVALIAKDKAHPVRGVAASTRATSPISTATSSTVS
jgi:hypothetical protein